MSVNRPPSRLHTTRRYISHVVRRTQAQLQSCFGTQSSNERDTFALREGRDAQPARPQEEILTGLQATLELYNLALAAQMQKKHKTARKKAINTNNKLLEEIEKARQENNPAETQRLQRRVERNSKKQAKLIPAEELEEGINALSELNAGLANLNSLWA